MSQQSQGARGVRCNLPDTIIGIGLGGKSIVYQFMQTDWVLDEALEPREDTTQDGHQMPPEGVTAHVIDTASVEQDDDEVMTKRINEQIEKKAEREFGLSPAQARTEINYVNPIDQTDVKYIGPNRLTMRGPVRTIAQENGLNAWWLRESNDMLVGDDDYKDGVVRRRGLSKALFHASRIQGDPFNDIINHNDEDVALVVGLGGGTGSGMFLDLAQELNKRVDRVHLYAIIPSRDEKIEPRANAHAALSELEYLSLTGQSPFKNTVLFPFESTREIGDMDEYYDAMVNTIIAHQNFEADDWDSLAPSSAGFGPQRYAPFVLAMPQTLRYVVGDIQKARDTLKEFSQERLDGLEIEHELYDALETFVTDEVGGDAAENLEIVLNGGSAIDNRFSLSVEEADNLRDRLDDLQRMLGLEALEDLEYQAIQDWQETLADRIQAEEEALEDDDAARVEINEVIVTEVPTMVDAMEPVEEKYPRDEANQLLDRYIRKELTAIRRRGNLYRVAALIEDETLREGLRMALDKDVNAVVAGSDLKLEQSQLDNDIGALEANVQTLENYIDQVLQSEVDDRVERWKQTAIPTVDKLVSLDENEDQLLDLLAELEDAINRAVADINNADRVAALDTDPLEFQRFDELNERLREVDLDPIQEQDLVTSLQFAAEAKGVWLEGQEMRDSLVGRLLLGLGLSGDGDLADDYSQYRAAIDPELISINDQYEPGFEFRCQYVGQEWFEDIRTEIESQREVLVNELIKEFQTLASEPAMAPEDFQNDVEPNWQTTKNPETPEDVPRINWPGDTDDDVESLHAEFRGRLTDIDPNAFVTRMCTPGDENGDNIIYRGIEQAVAGPVETECGELRRAREALEERKATYDQLIEIIDTEGRGLAELEMESRIPPIEFEGFVDSDFTYIKETSGQNPNSLIHRDDIVDANIVAEERGTVIDTFLNDFSENLTNTDSRFPLDYTEIDARGADLESPMYEQHQMISVYMSRIFGDEGPDLSETFDTVEDRIREAIYLPNEAEGYVDRVVGFGGQWDISMVSFLGGVFLDNISPVTSDNGYYASYRDQQDTLQEDVRVRHTHGVDGRDLEMVSEKGQGAFVYREDLLNLNRNEDRVTVTNSDEEELIAEFKNRQQIEEFDSEFDLGVDISGSEPDAGEKEADELTDD